MHGLVGAKPPDRSLDLDALRQQLSKALGPNIGVACKYVDGDPQVLWPIEREAVLKAIPRRQREFAAGRAAAREAMIQVGWAPESIPSAPDRAPIWPEGLVGSIAHNRHICVAIIGRRDQVHALGLDIEEDIAMDPTLWTTICTPVELATIAALPQSERGGCVTRLFCAKEAFYKWQYPQTQRMLDFSDVQVSFNPDHTAFSVLPALSGNTSVHTCGTTGRLMVSNGMVTAWLIGLPASQMRGE